MLTAEEIKSIAGSGEGFNAEFKEHVPSKVRELTEEVCGFVNAAGGNLLIGVSDRNIIKGANIDNRKRSAIQDSLNEINPPVSCPFYSVDVDGKTIWVIEVSSGPKKPYFFSGNLYIRQGPNTQKITSAEQMRDFFQQADRIYFDEGQCIDFSLNKDIDKEFFEEFRMTAGFSSTINRNQIIKNLKLTYPDGTFKNGAVLFFAKNPEYLFEKAVIRCVAFEGITKTNIIDDKVYGGPLMRQYQQAMQWLKGKLNIRYLIEGAGPRKEIWEIPETVFKEAIINALSHRDYYDKGARTTLELFKDRAEITNPGGLVSAISPSEFGTKSHSRNPLIFGLFERIHMVEQIGSGISRIRVAMTESLLPEPEFKTEGMFTVIYQRPVFKDDGKTVEKIVEETVEETREKIIKLIKENSHITIPELASHLKLTPKGIEYHITKLKKEKRIKHIGPRKSGEWIIS